MAIQHFTCGQFDSYNQSDHSYIVSKEEIKMAVIQIKRRTSAGTGPIVGTAGTIKAGEPLIDLNGTNLYISKADKTGFKCKSINSNDYIKLKT